MILLTDLKKDYQGRRILDGVSLSIYPGEVVALVGPNGAGKSTTLRIVAGVIRPDAGTAVINGYDVTSEEGRSGLGYLPQKLGIPQATTVEALVRLVSSIRRVRLDLALAAVEGAGLSARLGASMGELSGGQKQRIMLAMATLGSVHSLLLDEPGISLDMDGSEYVHDKIRVARDHGAAVLFASHHLADVAALADRVAILVEGRMVANGTLPYLGELAGVTWSGSQPPPIETIYRTLVSRNRARRSGIRVAA